MKITATEAAALEVLRQTGVNVLDAALVAKEALAKGRGRVKRARACIEAGDKALRLREKTVCFDHAVREALKARSGLRSRTINDFRYITCRLLKLCQGLAMRRVRSITPEDCTAYLQQAFHTPRQRNKARLILSGIFSTACKRGWCSDNPVSQVEVERVTEQRIHILKPQEVRQLISAGEDYRGGNCLAALGLMLYAGIRPHEVERLYWSDIRLEDGVIVISPRHSKTGGARHVTIHPPLAKILRRVRKADHERICPPNWRRRWSELHKAAGFANWQPDVLRHTFATHHLTTFRNYAELQLEMGHRSADLLRTRYVAMSAQCEKLLVEA